MDHGDPYARAIHDLLNEVNDTRHLDLELHPSWNYTNPDAGIAIAGYKLHRRTEEARTMSLAVDVVCGFDCAGDGAPALNAAAKGQILAAIESFWDSGNSDRHAFVRITRVSSGPARGAPLTP